MTHGRFDRRAALGMAAGGLGAAALPMRAAARADEGDEAFWAGIAAQYDITDDVIQLENGNWGAMARPVLDTHKALIERVNRDTSYYARRGMGADLAAAHGELAEYLGVGTDELVFTRNATEALKALIGGYNRIGPGDAALIADLDYGSMQASMEAATARRGARLVRIALPEPATFENVIAAYEAAFAADPTIKLVLLTHISHRTGLMIPVREIVERARARCIDAIVDAAHSLGQADFRLPELGADFVGVNLHKWVGAPLGVGALYIRKERIAAIDPDLADEERGSGRASSRIHTGTVDFAALLSVPEALRFQARIGAARRAARLRALRDRWVKPLRAAGRLEILTPDDPRMHVGITSFRIPGGGSPEANAALAARLLEQYNIFTVHRTGVAGGACVRVTPALFTSMADMDALAEALRSLVRPEVSLAG